MNIPTALPKIFDEYKLLIENIGDFHFVSVHWYLNQQGYVLMDPSQETFKNISKTFDLLLNQNIDLNNKADLISILIELFKKCGEKIKDFKEAPADNLNATTIVDTVAEMPGDDLTRTRITTADTVTEMPGDDLTRTRITTADTVTEMPGDDLITTTTVDANDNMILSDDINLNLEINILSQEVQDNIGTGSMITPGARLDDDHKKEEK